MIEKRLLHYIQALLVEEKSYAKSKGKENQRDTGLRDLSDEEIKKKIKDPRTSKKAKKQLQKEQKARGQRNVRKRAGYSGSK